MIRFEAMHMKGCGPDEVWWILDNKTETCLDLSFSTGFDAWSVAMDMNFGVRDRNGCLKP